MARTNRHRAGELNLTPTRALPLLLDAERALGSTDAATHRRALDNVRDALKSHVRYGLHKAKARKS